MFEKLRVLEAEASPPTLRENLDHPPEAQDIETTDAPDETYPCGIWKHDFN